MNYGYFYFAPDSREDLLKFKANHGRKAQILAGGTTLIPSLSESFGDTQFAADIKRIAEENEYNYISNSVEALGIGAAVTFYDLADCDFLDEYSILPGLCFQMGNPQIRYRATAVGSICTGDFGADILAALFVYDAAIAASSIFKGRMIPISEFFVSSGKTALEENEIVEWIFLPSFYKGWNGRYHKIERNDKKGSSLAVALITDGNVLRAALSGSSVKPIFLGEFDKSISLDNIMKVVLEKIVFLEGNELALEEILKMIKEYIEKFMEEPLDEN